MAIDNTSRQANYCTLGFKLSTVSVFLSLFCLGIISATAAPSPTSSPSQLQLLAKQIAAQLPAFRQVDRLTTADQYRANRARVVTSLPERLLARMLSYDPDFVEYLIAHRRAPRSQGAAEVAQELHAKLSERTLQSGTAWMSRILSELPKDTSCLVSVWHRSITPLLAFPEGRELTQDLIYRLISQWTRGGTLPWACRTLAQRRGLQEQLVIGLFNLYLQSTPDVFEALELYQSLEANISRTLDKRLLAASLFNFTNSPDAQLSLEANP